MISSTIESSKEIDEVKWKEEKETGAIELNVLSKTEARTKLPKISLERHPGLWFEASTEGEIMTYRGIHWISLFKQTYPFPQISPSLFSLE